MSDRKRINISLDPESYERLLQLQRTYGFTNTCQLIVAITHILVDRMDAVEKRRYDLPDDDGRYIDGMFDDLRNVERTPDGTVPVRHNRRRM